MKDIIKQLKEALKDCCDLLDEIEVNKGVNGRAALELREGNALPPMELLRKMEAFIPSGKAASPRSHAPTARGQSRSSIRHWSLPARTHGTDGSPSTSQ